MEGKVMAEYLPATMKDRLRELRDSKRMSQRDVADMLGIGMNSVYKLLRSGSIKAMRIGRIWKIPKRAVQEYILQQTQMKMAGWI